LVLLFSDYSRKVYKKGFLFFFMRESTSSKLAYITVGTELKRKCGLATFNNNLTKNMNKDPRINPVHVRYAPLVKGEQDFIFERKSNIGYVIDQDNPDVKGFVSYCVGRSKELGDNGYDLFVLMNHEFGPYRDKNGKDFSVDIAKGLKEAGLVNILIPHTGLRDPEKYGEDYRGIMENLLKYPDQIIGLTPSAIDIFKSVYGAPREALCQVDHGINGIGGDLPTRKELKKRFGLENRFMLGSGGLFSRGKDYITPMIAMARLKNEKNRALLKERGFDDIGWLITGMTHPDVYASEKEAYREEVLENARKYGLNCLVLGGRDKPNKGLAGLDNHELSEVDVIMVNEFLDDRDSLLSKIIEDLGIVANNGPDQISSGEVARHLEARRSFLATESPYTFDMAAQGVGATVSHGSKYSWYKNLRHTVLRSNLRLLNQASATKGSTMYWLDQAKKIVNVADSLISYKKRGD
jgi:hypothetical protein